MSSSKTPSPFLVLAPTQSNSYPASPVGSPSTAAVSTALSAVPLDDTHKRTSSVSSTSSEELKGLRFLKLGPVHFGGEPGVSDYAD